MKTAEIKLDLHNKIENIATEQLKDIYGLVVNYLNSNDTIEEWSSLTESQKESIAQGLQQAEIGLGNPLIEVNKRLRKKYGVNG